jgi:glyoxylase-like metal-dependent hydrolase (beta-lactamase superfamily II)
MGFFPPPGTKNLDSDPANRYTDRFNNRFARQDRSPMQRERVADDIYVFTSELYAQVTAGAVITPEGAILIDTLVFPEEARAIKNFLENRLTCPVRYVINTHYHADHTYGTCYFPEAQVVAHARCYDLLDTRGRDGLRSAAEHRRTARSGDRAAAPRV